MQVNSDLSNCLGNWENYRKTDRLTVTSTANVLFVADSSNDGIIVIFFGVCAHVQMLFFCPFC